MKGEKGFSLVEVMVAVLLLGIVAVALLSAVSTASRCAFIASGQASGESLARSEMEYVKSQGYSAAPWSYELPSETQADPPDWWDEGDPHALSDDYLNYNVTVDVVALYDTDNGIQKITVAVLAPSGSTVTLQGYRSMR
jgi:prepilin-type N-terminal cleavage/methylation domain-containing protein